MEQLFMEQLFMEQQHIDHCVNCFSTSCSFSECRLSACSCGAQMHSCKMADHVLAVCGNQTMPCINAAYGCKAWWAALHYFVG